MRKVEYVCFANRSGYAQAAQDLMVALHSSGRYDLGMLCLHGQPDHISVTPERYELIMKLCERDFVPDKDSFQVFHCIPEMQLRVTRMKKSVGFATFETFQPPEVWIPILNQNDVVICPSHFNAKIFEHAGVKKPIVHIPHCVDTTAYNPQTLPSDKQEPYTFLFMGTWKERKGWKHLIEAWFREFDVGDNVRLVIKTDKITQSRNDIERLKSSLGFSKKETAPIVHETRVLTEAELPRFIKNSDCLVSPTLGEGFGLPGLQAMALEVPVIITNFSGCTDYATSETATLIEPTGYRLIQELDTISQFSNRKWANVEVQSVRWSMRYVLCNADIVKTKAKRAAEIVARDYSYGETVKRFDAMVDSYL
jgi:glycosyltransferase involved in cell wall biosynthesis